MVKRRGLAKELCEEGAISLNGRVVRAGRGVAAGDRLQVRLWNRLMEVEIERLPEGASPCTESRRLYKLLSETRLEEFNY